MIGPFSGPRKVPDRPTWSMEQGLEYEDDRPAWSVEQRQSASTVRPAFSSWDSATVVRFSIASSVPGARAARSITAGEKASARSLAASPFARPPLPLVITDPIKFVF
ncbi:hypothetical protein LR48_Vigan393s000800 [Vigna angularis]|uniref:Uncharacterized protein n=1 Tax=Phaseolus angularis TaxID=3914 RepID=A0A0L9TAB5_PHAAN|nr:hypothetical protein LR48_Vigan393s000800 [Vigna angularis]